MDIRLAQTIPKRVVGIQIIFNLEIIQGDVKESIVVIGIVTLFWEAVVPHLSLTLMGPIQVIVLKILIYLVI
jgi:hypothetical protein